MASNVLWCNSKDMLLTVRAGRDMGPIGAKHTRQAEVGQLTDVAARVLLGGLHALDKHIGALQITAQQQRDSHTYFSATLALHDP